MSLELLLTLITLAIGSFCVAFLVLYGFAWIAARHERSEAITLDSPEDEIIFLFDDETLVNATPSAHHVLSSAADVGSDWSKFLSVVISKFPNLQSDISSLADQGTMNIESRDGGSVLKMRMAHWVGPAHTY